MLRIPWTVHVTNEDLTGIDAKRTLTSGSEKSIKFLGAHN